MHLSGKQFNLLLKYLGKKTTSENFLLYHKMLHQRIFIELIYKLIVDSKNKLHSNKKKSKLCKHPFGGFFQAFSNVEKIRNF